MGEVGESFEPIAVLIDELKNEEVEIRLNSVRRLGTIAVALGLDRTRNELIPFLTDLGEDEDEVQSVLAEELGNFVEHVGGPDFAACLLPPLEQLSKQEETVVRNKAVESLIKIANQMKPEIVAESFVRVVRNLAKGDWFTSRISACGLFAVAYERTSQVQSPAAQAALSEIQQLYIEMCTDETPMVRRAVSSNFGAFAQVVDKGFLQAELLPQFAKLAEDSQDSVRLLSVDNCVKLAGLLSEEEKMQFIVPVVKQCGEDKSWRVRYCAAEKIATLATALGQQLTNLELMGLFVRLLKDSEAEVRGAAAKQVSEMAKAAAPAEVVFDQILPCVEELVHDSSQHVRTSLASAIMGLAPVVGHEGTIAKLVPLFLVLLQDEIPEVRLNVVSKIGEVNTVVGIQVLSERLLPAIVGLARYRMWRVRHAVIEHIPTLAKQLGAEYFSDRPNTDAQGMSLLELCIEWLHDEVHTIRDAAAKNLKLLAEAFGAEWATEHLIPQVATMCSSNNYLYRLTTLACCAMLSESLGASPGTARLLDMVAGMATDPVPNVRFNVSKALVKMIPSIDPPSLGSKVKPMLQTMCEDPDQDVKYYAYQALQQIA
eukprot:TRINITY_DN204_c0_g1_i1.p1 TRINITY_DN204_c0_g1~~TRINITY_DN204_c0_g1_i1.p1  ORF type:complete len:599 (+),score=184.35 TRINITY_DN204_c0_g1_i1:202-1998(+)